RPVRREADFEAGADRAAPAGVVGGRNKRATGHSEHVILVVDDRGAALYVEQHVVPGIADLAGEQPKGVDPGAILGAANRIATNERGVAAGKVGSVALGFEAEHPVGRLPAIADLATDSAAGRVMATFRNVAEGHGHQIPAGVGRAAAAVD